MVFNIARDFDRVYLGISLWQSVDLMNSEQEKQNIESQDAREISGSFRCLTTLSVKKLLPMSSPNLPWSNTTRICALRRRAFSDSAVRPTLEGVGVPSCKRSPLFPF